MIRLKVCGMHWRSKAELGTVPKCNPLLYRALLCRELFINELMEKHLDKRGTKQNGVKPLLLAIINPPGGRILCSPEHGKLCFEALETNVRASKQTCPCRGLKTLSEVEVFIRIKMDCDD